MTCPLFLARLALALTLALPLLSPARAAETGDEPEVFALIRAAEAAEASAIAPVAVDVPSPTAIES